MTKVTYKSLNPGIVLVIEGEHCSPMLEMPIFNEDGTPYVYKEPTDQEMAPMIKRMLDALGTTDTRTVALAVMMVEELLVKATQHCATAVHNIMHDPATSHLDSGLMHDGLAAYMDGSTIISSDITPENVGEHVLQNFFPDTKPH